MVVKPCERVNTFFGEEYFYPKIKSFQVAKNIFIGEDTISVTNAHQNLRFYTLLIKFEFSENQSTNKLMVVKYNKFCDYDWNLFWLANSSICIDTVVLVLKFSSLSSSFHF